MTRTDDEYIGSRDLTSWPTRAGRSLVRQSMHLREATARRLDESKVPYVVLFVTAGVGLAGTALLTAASTEIYEDVVAHDGVAGFDRPVLDQMIDWRSHDLNTVVTDYTDLGGATIMPVIALVAAVVLAWWWRKWTPLLLMAIAAGGSVLFTVVGKQLVGRVRPDRSLAVPPFETSPSFPSGHTLNSWVVFLLIAYLVVCRVDRLWLRVVTVATAVVLALAMGLSRVYLGHHWLTDVLVGWTLGSAWLLVVITGHRLALTVQRAGRR